MSTAEQLLETTVKLSTYNSGRPTGSGTGFFYGIDLPGGADITLIVTNKHVLRGSDEVRFVAHVARVGVGETVTPVTLNYDFDLLTHHPSEDVDLCGINLGPLTHDLKRRGERLKFTTTARSDVPTQEEWSNLDAIEEVTMIGCPSGIYDEVNNLPIVRRGITSSNPSKHYNGKPEFLVDMACFPGSSGSPIFLWNPMGYLDRTSNTRIIGGRIKLLGILYSGPVYTAKGEVVLVERPKVAVGTMMHLGFAIRSSEILELEKQEVAAFNKLSAASGDPN